MPRAPRMTAKRWSLCLHISLLLVANALADRLVMGLGVAPALIRSVASLTLSSRWFRPILLKLGATLISRSLIPRVVWEISSS
mgnify:CR=1 FL=1